MGYYSTLEYMGFETDIKFQGPKLKISVEELNKKIQNRFNETAFGDISFEPMKEELNRIDSVEKIDMTAKYTGEEERKFAEFLADHLEEGVITYAFTGEEGEQWGYVIFPGLWLSFDGRYVNSYPENFLNEETLEKIRKNKESINFFKKIFEEYEQKLRQNAQKAKKALLKINGYECEVRIPAEERRIVQYDLISYFKDKKKAEQTVNQLKEMSEKESLETIKDIISIDETEDIEVIESWQEEIDAKDTSIEKIKL